MSEIITHGDYEYRKRGGEIHRRPAEREHLHPVDAAWLVLNADQRKQVPAIVEKNLAESKMALRFD